MLPNLPRKRMIWASLGISYCIKNIHLVFPLNQPKGKTIYHSYPTLLLMKVLFLYLLSLFDVYSCKGKLFIAMAVLHQIWEYDLDQESLRCLW